MRKLNEIVIHNRFEARINTKKGKRVDVRVF